MDMWSPFPAPLLVFIAHGRLPRMDQEAVQAVGECWLPSGTSLVQMLMDGKLAGTVSC